MTSRHKRQDEKFYFPYIVDEVVITVRGSTWEEHTLSRIPDLQSSV
jgi:hypothetical protein